MCRVGAERAKPLPCIRAGRGNCAGGESCGGGRARDPGGVGGDGWAVWVVSERDFGGLESGPAGDADCDAVCGHSTAPFGEDAGRRAATAYVFCGRGWQREISSEWRRLPCVCEGYWWGRVVPAVSV